MRGEFFKGVHQWELQTMDGKFAGKLPVFYYDNTSMTAVYTASTAKVKKYLPHPDMHPAEIFPGRCLVGFSAFEYRRTDIGPYNEFSISIIIIFGRKGIPALSILPQIMRRHFNVYIWHLPVTTEIARTAGVEFYGYPKFIAEIAFKREKDCLECRLSEKGSHILTLRGKHLDAKPGKIMRFKTYSVKNGIPICANIDTNPIEFVESWRRNSATIEIGSNHSISHELNGIELSKQPILYQYSPVNELILFGARNLRDNQ
ncbi:MAG TPA: acetoacetate decarboxylase family protein [bacterium]